MRGGWGRRAGWPFLLGVSLAALVAPGPAAADRADAPVSLAQATSERRQFTVPAGDLRAALLALSEQGDLQLIYPADLTAGLTTRGVSGNLTPRDALTRLLTGTGLVYTFTGGGTVTLAKPPAEAGAVALDPITVAGATYRHPGQTEGTGSYAGAVATVGSKMPTTVREIPNSVSVITRQRIEDEGFVSLQDAVEQTTGMRVQTWDDDRASFSARGFDASVLRDGVPVTHRTNFTATPDLVAYDRVEIMRGPAGLFHGAGEPGGSINLVRKRALGEFRAKGAMQYGSWENYLAEVDVTGPILEDGRLRGRLAGSYQDKESFLDLYEQEKPTIYGTLEADLNESTTFSIGGIYFEQDKHQFQGLPLVDTNGDWIRLSRDTNIGAPWSRGHEDSTDLFAELEHFFDNGIALKVSGRQVDRARQGIVNYVVSAIDPVTGDVDAQAWKFDGFSKDTVLDANLSIPMRLFGQHQQFLVGTDYTYSEEVSSWASSARFTMNAFDPDHDIAEPAFSDASPSLQETWQKGAYAQGNIKPGIDWLTLVLGGRMTWWDYTREDKRTGVRTSENEVDAEFTPKAGLVFDLTPEISAYGSYSSIFAPQTSLDPSGKVIKPREGEQFEVGLKGEFLSGRLLAHMAVFQIEDRNRATFIEDCVGNLCYEAAGLVRARGFEAEVSGSPLPGLQLFAGYAFTETEYVDDPDNEGDSYAPYLPKHMFNLSGLYSFEDGDLDGLSLGAGVRVRGAYFNTIADNRYTQDAFALFDGRIGYALTENLSAQVAVNNIFDKKYYERLGGSTRNNYWGEPRNVMLTVRGTW